MLFILVLWGSMGLGIKNALWMVLEGAVFFFWRGGCLIGCSGSLLLGLEGSVSFLDSSGRQM